MQELLRITSCGLMLDPELYLSVIPVLQDDSRYHVAVFHRSNQILEKLAELEK